MRTSRRLALALLLCLPAAARADETPIDRSAVPKAVLDAVARKFPRARQLRFAREVDKGVEAFEVELVDGPRRVDVSLAMDGTLLVEEEVIKRSAVPDPVLRAFGAHATYGSWKLARAERIVKRGNTAQPTFELVVARGRKRVELLFDRDGRLLEP